MTGPTGRPRGTGRALWGGGEVRSTAETGQLRRREGTSVQDRRRTWRRTWRLGNLSTPHDVQRLPMASPRERRREILSESRMREIRTSGCASSEGWHVQQEKGLPGQKSEPRSLDSRVAGNQDSEAYRQRLPWGGDESPGRNNSERKSGLESE